jgi:hypothetical protein
MWYVVTGLVGYVLGLFTLLMIVLGLGLFPRGREPQKSGDW